MTVGWLRKALEKFKNDDAEIFISVSKVYFPLCGKIDRLMIIYETKDDPGIRKGEEAIVFFPCECSSEEEDKKKGDNLFLN